jgi:hypothetical protein
MAKASAVDETIERLVCKRFPGARIGWMRIGDGPPQRAALMRTEAPFPSLTRELIAADGRRFEIHMFCDNGNVFVTWGHVELAAALARAKRSTGGGK